jgi:hypothetical protein
MYFQISMVLSPDEYKSRYYHHSVIASQTSELQTPQAFLKNSVHENTPAFNSFLE